MFIITTCAGITRSRKLLLVGLTALISVALLNGCATADIGASLQRKVKEKTYVIIGASSGFGRGVAEKVGKTGAKVLIAARRGEALEEVARVIRAGGGTAIVLPTDISQPEAVAALQKVAIRELGHVDVWINMAGVGVIGRFWEIPIEDQAKIIDINLKGFVYGSHAAVNIFKTQGYGTLINMGSIESINPLAYHASYSATKAGVLNLSKIINHELRLAGYKNIKVVTIEPWAVDTPFWRHAANYSGGTARMAAMDPPEKVVNAVVRVSIRPRRELAVGWKAKGAKFSHWLLPGFTERISANIAHGYQIRKAPPADTTSGSVFHPVKEGTGIDDGVRDRIKREKKEMKKKRR